MRRLVPVIWFILAALVCLVFAACKTSQKPLDPSAQYCPELLAMIDPVTNTDLAAILGREQRAHTDINAGAYVDPKVYFAAVLAPDKQRIAYRSFINSISIYNKATKQFRDISNPPQGTADAYPHWSADGNQIVFNRISGNSDREALWLIIMNADGTNSRQLTAETAGQADIVPEFVPGKQQVLFERLTQRPPLAKLSLRPYLVDTNTGDVRVLAYSTDTIGDLASQAVSPQGNIVALVTRRATGTTAAQNNQFIGDKTVVDILILPLDGTEVKKIISIDQGFGHGPIWTNDGKFITFQTSGLDQKIVLLDIDGNIVGSCAQHNNPQNGMPPSI